MGWTRAKRRLVGGLLKTGQQYWMGRGYQVGDTLTVEHFAGETDTMARRYPTEFLESL